LVKERWRTIYISIWLLIIVTARTIHQKTIKKLRKFVRAYILK
jgi:hypothetical protein